MERIVVRLALLLLTALPGFSQLLSVGVKAGYAPTSLISSLTQIYSYYSGAYGAYDRLYVIGPTAEVHLPRHLSLEVDALFRRSGFESYGLSKNNLSVTSRTLLNDWQFPVLAKYERSSGPLGAFVDGGLVIHYLNGATNPSTLGEAAGGGLVVKVWRLHLSPELRYTHFNTAPYSNANGADILQSSTNQAELLVGFTF